MSEQIAPTGEEGGEVNSLASPPSPLDPNVFEFIGHVDPPPGTDTRPEGMFHYIGPRLFPIGVYMPKGYDIEGRPGNDEGWTVLRARCLATGQVMTMWAVGPMDAEGHTAGIDTMEGK